MKVPNRYKVSLFQERNCWPHICADPKLSGRYMPAPQGSGSLLCLCHSETVSAFGAWVYRNCLKIARSTLSKTKKSRHFLTRNGTIRLTLNCPNFRRKTQRYSTAWCKILYWISCKNKEKKTQLKLKFSKWLFR